MGANLVGLLISWDGWNDKIEPGGNSTAAEGDPPETQAALKYNSKTPRGHFKRLLQNAQLALINLCGSGPDNPGPIALGNKRFYSREDYCVNSDHAFTSAAAAGGKSWLSGYSLICPIRSTSQFPPDVALSAMVAQGEEANEFFSFGLSSAQKALLVPLIKIYKMEYPVDKKTGKIKPNSDPNNKVEILFDSYTSDGDIEQMLTHHTGKMHATGIESFEWALKGVNPGEVDNNIEASLKIYFNNISSLFYDNLRQLQGGAGVHNRASFLDLIVFAPPFQPGAAVNPDPTICSDRVYEGRFFEIRADVGWQIPPNSAGMFADSEIDAIKKANVSLFLQLTDHSFDFKEDGSATLDINYRARSALIDERFDILGLNAPGSEIANFKENEMADTLRQIQIEQAAAEGSGRTNVTDVHQELINKQAAQEKTLAGMLRESYSDIVKELLHKHVYSAVIPLHLLAPPNPNNKTPDADVETALRNTKGVVGAETGPGANEAAADNPDVDVGLESGTSVATVLANGSGSAGTNNPALEAITTAYNTAAKDTQVYGPHPLQGDGKGISNLDGTAEETIIYMEDNEFNKLVPSVRGRGSYSVGGSPGAHHVDQATGVHTGGHWFQYFYLGDIIEIFLAKKSVIDAVGRRQKAFVTTDIEFVNSRLVLDAVKKGGGTLPVGALSCGFRGLPREKRRQFMSVVNLANIPISVELFLDFMKRKIIATQRTTYYIEDFLQDLNNEFVKPIFLQLGFSKPNHGPISCVTNATVDLSCKLLGGDYRGYPNGASFTGKTGQSARGAPGAVGTNEGTTVWDDEHFMSDLLTLEANRRGKSAQQATAGAVVEQLIAAANPPPPSTPGVDGGGGITGTFLRVVESVPVTNAANTNPETGEPDPTPLSFSLRNGKEFERELVTTETAAQRLQIEAARFRLSAVNLRNAITAIEAATPEDLATARAVFASGASLDHPNMAINQLAQDLALVQSAEETVGSGGLEMAETLQLMDELATALIAAAHEAIEAVAAQRAARGWAPKWGNTVIADVEGYMYGAVYTGTNAPPEEQAASKKRGVIFPNPAYGELKTCEVKIISFQNYFGSHLGDYDDNLKKGIPNFVVGLDRGVVKGVSFERVDQPHLRESRVSKTRSAGAEQLRELYNVTLKLYGNTLLKPGQIIYVEPNQLIFGRPTQRISAARILGLGGYHLVVDVANEISKDGWETTVKALHVAMPAPIGPQFRYAMRTSQTPAVGIERAARKAAADLKDEEDAAAAAAALALRAVVAPTGGAGTSTTHTAPGVVN